MKTIELSEWEINTILDVLGGQPYNKVAPIITHILVQIDPERKDEKEETA